MGEDGLLSGKNILKIDRANIPALIIVHLNGDEESVIRIEGAEGGEGVRRVIRKLLPMGQICFQLIAAVKGIAGDEEFTGGGEGRNFQIIERSFGRGRFCKVYAGEMKKIFFLLGEEKERTAGNNGMEGGDRGELHIGFIGEAEEMEGLIVGTILIEKPVIGDKIGIIDFLFQNGCDV